MMVQDNPIVNEVEGSFLSILENQLQASNNESNTDTLFQEPWKLLLKKGLPSRHNEEYKYLNLTPFYKSVEPLSLSNDYKIEQEVESALSKFNTHSCLVYINGSFSKEHSRLNGIEESGIEVLSMDQAIEDYSVFIRQRWSELLSIETDPMYLLSMANAHKGAFIYVPPKIASVEPILILNLCMSSTPAMSLPFLQVYTAKGSSIQLIQAENTANPSHISMGVDFICDVASHAQLLQSPVEAVFSNAFFGVRASINKDASFKCSYLSLGSTIHRYDYHVLLQGENASVDLRGVNCLNDQKQSHGRVLIEHKAPACHSNQYFRSILDDRSKSSFNGKIYVHQIAQQTEAYQLDQKLVLNDKAQAYTKPNLEIFADDVKASHGATIGRLDADQIFYLRTRGLSIAQARSILLKGFAKEVFEEISLAIMQDIYNQHIDNYLKD